MLIQAFQNISLSPAARSEVEAFLAHLLPWHAKLKGSRLMIEYDQPILGGKSVMAFTGTSMRVNRDGDAQILGIKALMINGD